MIAARLLLPLLLLASLPAMGATRYVAPAGSCAHHATVGTSFVSAADAKTAGCTLAKPCATMQDAIDKAAGGDAIEVHDGTETVTAVDGGDCLGSPSASTRHGCTDTSGQFGWVNQKFGAGIRAASGALTISCASGDACALALNLQAHSGFVDFSTSAVSISGLSISGALPSAGGSARYGGVIKSNTGDLTLTDVAVSYASANCVSGDQEEHYLRDDGSGALVVIRPVLSGCQSTGVDVHQASGAKEVYISDANFTGSRGDVYGSGSFFTPFRLEGLGASGARGHVMIVRSLVQRGAGSTNTVVRFVYFREMWSTTRIFDNICINCGPPVEHQTCCTTGGAWPEEDLAAFNNTFTDGASSGDRPGYWDQKSLGWQENNVFNGYSATNQLNGVDSGSDTSADRSSSNAGNSHSICGTSSCVTLSSGPDIAHVGNVVGTVTLDGSYRPGIGSIADGAGIVDPEHGGDGATCSFTAAGHTEDCSLDYYGAARGASWTIGAVQVSASATPPKISGLKMVGATLR